MAVAGAACAGTAAEHRAPGAESRVAAGRAAAEAADAGRGGTDREAEQVAAIEWAVRQTAAAVHLCYKRALADDFRREGRVVVDIVFSGGAPRVEVVRDATHSAKLRSCLVATFSELPWPPVFDAGDRVQLPLSFVAPPAQYTVWRRDVDERDVAPGAVAQVVVDERNTGNPAASLTYLRLAPGAALPAHRAASTALVYLVQGRAAVVDASGRHRRFLAAGDAVYVPPGAALGLAAEPGGAEFVVAYAPAGPEQRFDGGASAGDAGAAAREGARWLAVTGADLPRYPVAGGAAEVAIYFDAARAGDGRASLDRISVRPGARLPAHVHADATEVVYLLDGGGEVEVAGERYPVGPHTAVQIPAGTPHAFYADPDRGATAVQIYTPAGPEQRFKP